jgi:hypothetical protein
MQACTTCSENIDSKFSTLFHTIRNKEIQTVYFIVDSHHMDIKEGKGKVKLGLSHVLGHGFVTRRGSQMFYTIILYMATLATHALTLRKFHNSHFC